MPQHVTVTAYDPRWPQLYEREAAAISAALGGALSAIHHIGSTAVPGLAAKPIIDIMPVVHSLSGADAARGVLEALGYEYLGEFGIPGRSYLRRGGDERTHQVHIFAERDRENIARHLVFRDYLRAHPDVCAEYAALKRALAARYPYDIESYCDGKADFVKKYESLALAWAEGR